MKRPRITPERVQALKVLADKARPVAKARRNDLFSGTREERAALRRAIKFVDDLAKWHKVRAREAAGAK